MGSTAWYTKLGNDVGYYSRQKFPDAFVRATIAFAGGAVWGIGILRGMDFQSGMLLWEVEMERGVRVLMIVLLHTVPHAQKRGLATQFFLILRLSAAPRCARCAV